MELETTFVVKRPTEEVYEAWVDLERSPEWASDGQRVSVSPTG